jgi:hypothetical protein
MIGSTSSFEFVKVLNSLLKILAYYFLLLIHTILLFKHLYLSIYLRLGFTIFPRCHMAMSVIQTRLEHGMDEKP